MCDCYTDYCRVCKEPIAMHLADFSTDQSEVEVFCGMHIPPDRSDGVVWMYGDNRCDKRMFVRWLTLNARTYAGGNHPNYLEVEMEDVPSGTMEVLDERACPWQG